MRFSLLPFLCLAFTAHAADPAAEGLLKRRVPALADRISFDELPSKDGKDVFRLTHEGDRVRILGNSTNSRAAGLRWYLEHDCGMHFSWSGDQLAVPSPLPLPDQAPRTSPWKWRSAHNHCVFSYSMAFWDWPRWEREIDYLALQGINQAYLLTGHEKVWQNTLRRLGYTDAQIATWLPSTSHISWWHFDNLAGEGGPLTRHEIDNEAELARKVADRMRELGIAPVTLGFYGMVPDFFGTRFPDAKILPQGEWVGGYQRPPMLDPSDPAFAKTAAIWYEEMERVLGPVKFFAGDPFHEGGRPGNLNLPDAFKAIQDAMRAKNPDATWVMFGWTGNPREAALAKLDPEHVLIQQTSKDLGTALPVSRKFRDYGGKIPWTWQIIDNFGGNHGLYGNFDTVASLPSRFLNGGVPGNFAGLGHSPEGIETNPLQAGLYYDMFWRGEDVNVGTWLDETIPARYGKRSIQARAAWDLLARSSYRCPIEQEGISDYVFGTRPGPDVLHARTWSSNTPYWCELDIVEAWRLLLEAGPALSGSGNYRYDLVDVTRHALNFHSLRVQRELMAAFRKRDRASFDAKAAEFLALFDDLDSVLATDPNCLLGSWISHAREKGDDEAAKNRIERNARNQVTLWDGKHDSLDDYASRSWAGLVGRHYKGRWARYVEDLHKGWDATGIPRYSGDDLEQAFLEDRTPFPVKPTGDALALSKAIYERLSPAMRKSASLRWSLPQESDAETRIRFDVTERLHAGERTGVTLSREFGDAEAALAKVSLTTADGKALLENAEPAMLGKAPVSRSLGVFRGHPGRVFLEIVLRGPGRHAIANGPVTLGAVFDAKREDYFGRFEYDSQGGRWIRELRADGTLALYENDKEYAGWNGYTWRFENGEAILMDKGGRIFERHRLRDANILIFQMEPEHGEAKRLPGGKG